jgi:hypothetical protein
MHLSCSGSPYINGRDDVLENHFPIGMVFIFVTFAGVGLIAMMCGLLKLAEKRKERREEDDEDGEEDPAGKRSKRSMPTLSMLRPPSPRRDLLRRSNLDYLSVAALPLLSYRMLTRVASLSQGQDQGSQGHAKSRSRDFSDLDEFGDFGDFGGFGECGGGAAHLNGSVRCKGDRGCSGGGGESEESGADNLSVPLDYDDALNLGTYVRGPGVSQEDFCEIDLGLGGGVTGVGGVVGAKGMGGELDFVNNTAPNDPYTHYPHRNHHHRHTANDLTKCNNIAPNNIAPPLEVAPNNVHKPGPVCGASRDGNLVMCINPCESVV